MPTVDRMDESDGGETYPFASFSKYTCHDFGRDGKVVFLREREKN